MLIVIVLWMTRAWKHELILAESYGEDEMNGGVALSGY